MAREKMREDGHQIWTIIRQVREWLYVKGTNITSIFVKRMLTPESLVPSMVCSIYYILFCIADLLRMRFQLGSPASVSIFALCSSLIYFMNLNWVFGRQLLRILSMFSTHMAMTQYND
jgi:hypothetical protein